MLIQPTNSLRELIVETQQQSMTDGITQIAVDFGPGLSWVCPGQEWDHPGPVPFKSLLLFVLIHRCVSDMIPHHLTPTPTPTPHPNPHPNNHTLYLHLTS